ncbi:MAG: cytochrome P450 [Actinomycetes bacterium]
MSAAPPSEIDPDQLLLSVILDEDARQDPYPVYEQLRSRVGRWRNGFGGTVLTRYHDCVEALRHPKLGRPEPDMPTAGAVTGTPRRRPADGDEVAMLFLNPPDHTRIRSLVSRAFTPRRVEELRPAIARLLDPILEQLADQGGGNVVTDLAVPFPVAVISELLGVPRDGNEHIAPLVHDMTALIDAALDEEGRSRGEAAALQVAEYFVSLAAEKRRSPDGKMFSDLIEVESAGDRLSEAELIGNTMLLYAAGFETTSNLIGNGLWLLLRHPEQLRRLQADPSLVSPAVLEMLRHDSPVQLNLRAVLEPVELFGTAWQRGDTFVILQGAGNHDPAAYLEPDRFDVGRFTSDAPPPLSFGWGAHHCLGAHLARAEGEIVFGALAQRFSSIEVERSSLTGGTPRFRPSFTLRGLDSLPVRVN